jgi:hypothetical protein
MRVSNEGAVPVRLVADSRLLTFDVIERGAGRPQHCALPADMLPADDMERNLVVPPGRAYVETIEPRLYCFSGKELRALGPMSVVVARLGWGKRASPGGYHVVTADDASTTSVEPEHQLQAPPILLPDERYTERATDGGPPVQPPGGTDPLALRADEMVDAESADEIPISISIRNVAAHAQVLRFRPEAIGFDVRGATGTERCAWPAPAAAATGEQFIRLAPGAGAELALSLAAYCGGHALDDPGLLTATAWLDTRSLAQDPTGRQTFAGVVTSRARTFVRLHRGRAGAPQVRPQLE